MVRLVSAVTKTGKSCLQEQVSQVQEQADRDRQSDINYCMNICCCFVCTLFTCYIVNYRSITLFSITLFSITLFFSEISFIIQ